LLDRSVPAAWRRWITKSPAAPALAAGFLGACLLLGLGAYLLTSDGSEKVHWVSAAGAGLSWLPGRQKVIWVQADAQEPSAPVTRPNNRPPELSTVSPNAGPSRVTAPSPGPTASPESIATPPAPPVTTPGPIIAPTAIPTPPTLPSLPPISPPALPRP
jgi:hypothetical protein